MQNANINVNWVPGITLEEMEKQCILAAYRWYRSNKTQTSIALGISIRTLDNKLEKYESDNRKDEDRIESENLERATILDRMRGITNNNSNGHIYQPNTHASTRPAQPESSTNGNGSQTGLRVEPLADTAAQSSMSLPERKEVQSMLPKQTSQSGHGKRR